MRNKVRIYSMMQELNDLTELPICCSKSEEDKLAMVRAPYFVLSSSLALINPYTFLQMNTDCSEYDLHSALISIGEDVCRVVSTTFGVDT